jgi:hypothetical protein
MSKKTSNVINEIRDITDKIVTDYEVAEQSLKSRLNKINQMIDELVIESSLSESDAEQASDLTTDITDKLRLIQFDSVSELESEKMITKLKNRFNNQSNQSDKIWNRNFDLLIDFMTENGHCYFEENQKYNGLNLGKWVREQRKLFKSSTLEPYRRKKLDDIKIKDSAYILFSRFDTSSFLDRDESHYPNGMLEEIKNVISQNAGAYELDSPIENDFVDSYINYNCWLWSNQDASWIRYYKELKKFYSANYHCFVPSGFVSNDLKLGNWVLRIRQDYTKGLVKGGLYDDCSNPESLNRYLLLWNLFFVYETNLNNAFNHSQRTSDAKDILDMGKRANQYISEELFLDAYPSDKRIEKLNDIINDEQ